MNQGNWFDNGAQWMRGWFDFMTKMAEAATPFSLPASPPEAARQMRADMLQAWSQSFERFMRSPDFLQWMKSVLGANLQAQKQLNDALGQTQHRLQGASRQDIDELMRAVEHVEDALRRMSAQIDDLGARLDAGGKMPPRGEPRLPRKNLAADINGRADGPSEEEGDAEEPRAARTTRRKPIGRKRLP